MIAVLGPRPHGRHGDHEAMAGAPGPRRRAQAAPATGSGDTAAVTQNTTTSTASTKPVACWTASAVANPARGASAGFSPDVGR
jgi:hypothetical protein